MLASEGRCRLLPDNTVLLQSEGRDGGRGGITTVMGIFSGRHFPREVQFVHGLQDLNSQAEFDKAHQKWCEKTIAFFQTHSHQTRESFEFHYGQAQNGSI